MSRPRNAFTLIELLVVISIITILGGMVFAGVSIAKKASLKTKTSALISQVAAALSSYRLQNGVYPESYKDANNTDVFANAFNDTNGPKRADGNITWPIINTTLVTMLNATGQSFPQTLKDAWGMELRYRPAKYYPFDDNAPLPIDKDTNVPGRDSFQLWSTGPNKIDEFGAGDDLTSWTP